MGFMGTKVMQVVFKQTGGLVWKNWPMNHTRRANAKKRHRRLRQVCCPCASPIPLVCFAKNAELPEMYLCTSDFSSANEGIALLVGCLKVGDGSPLQNFYLT